MAGISGLQKTPGGSAERKKSGDEWMNAGQRWWLEKTQYGR